MSAPRCLCWTFALLQAACKAASPLACCSVNSLTARFRGTSFSPGVATGCSNCLEHSLSFLCWFTASPEPCALEKLKKHIFEQAPIKPQGKEKNTRSSQVVSSVQLVCLEGWFPAQASKGETEDLYRTGSKSQLEGCCRVFPVNLLLLHKTMSSSFCSSRQVCSEKG